MDFTTKCARALSLGGILSLILLTATFQATGTRKAEAQSASLEILGPLTYEVGDQIIRLRGDGKESTVTLVAKTDKTLTWKSDKGCWGTFQIVDPKSSTKWGFSPQAAWGCRSKAGEQESRLDGGQAPWPLKVGNWWSYSIDGSKANGSTWTDNRTCKVESIEKVAIELGTYDTFKVVCEQKSSTRTYYVSPQLGVVKFTREHIERAFYSWKLKKLVRSGSQ